MVPLHVIRTEGPSLVTTRPHISPLTTQSKSFYFYFMNHKQCKLVECLRVSSVLLLFFVSMYKTRDFCASVKILLHALQMVYLVISKMLCCFCCTYIVSKERLKEKVIQSFNQNAVHRNLLKH